MEDELDFMPPQQLLLVWLFRALGVRYSFLIPFYALLAFVLAALAIWKFKTPYLTAVLLAVVPLPFYCGAIGSIDGFVASFQVFSGQTISPAYVAEAGAVSLVSAQVGLVLSLPLYVIAVVALCLRSFVRQPDLEG